MSEVKVRKMALSTSLLLLQSKGTPFDFEELINMSLIFEDYIKRGVLSELLISKCIKTNEATK